MLHANITRLIRPFVLLAVVIVSSFSFTGYLYGATIAIYGDSQNDDDARRRIVEDIAGFNPGAVFRVGDMTDNGSDPAQWERFRDINKPLLIPGKYFPALGNHENDSPLYFQEFPFLKGRRWYSVDYAGIRFIILDSNSDLGLGSQQYKWLENELKTAEKKVKFKIVLFHHPILSVGGHYEDEKKLRPVLMPLFERFDITAVFSGHDHNYQRLEYEGIPFFVTGGAGSYLRDRTRESPYLKCYEKIYHYCILTTYEDSLKIKIYDIDNNLIDEYFIPTNEPAGLAQDAW